MRQILEITGNRWAVRLSGDMIDLREAIERFGIGTQTVCDQVLPEGEAVVLQADEFESLEDATEVYDAAERILVAVNAVLYLDDPARKELSIASIHQRGSSGGWSIAIFPKSASYRFRGAKARGQAGSLVGSPPPTQQSIWLQAGLNEETVTDALSYLRGTPDWIALYKAYEAINKDAIALKSIKGAIPGWPSQAEINAFTRDAQLHRHSKSWCEKKRITSTGAMTHLQHFAPRQIV
jgi:hypothetical protein